MSKPVMGTLAWADSGAALSLRERAALIADVARAQARWSIERSRRSRRAQFTARDVDSIPTIDTSVARACQALAVDICDDNVVAHCERSYCWSWLAARYEGLEVDPELLYVANVLHDLGLGEVNRAQAADGDFAIVGAKQAKNFLLTQGWSDSAATEVGDAIGMHLNPIVEAKRSGPLARALSIGPALDFFGFGSRRFSHEAIRAVTATYPRPTNSSDLLPNIQHGSRTRPQLLLQLGIGRFIDRNPLDKVAGPSALNSSSQRQAGTRADLSRGRSSNRLKD